ncbi:MAG: electron transfer flavoprotein subunit beta/FixA family protein [Nitrospinota bacterium]
MKFLIPVKRVPDPDTTIKLTSDGSGIVTDHVSFVISQLDEIALEEALRIREARRDVSEIVAVSIGGEEVTEQLRTALAMGADRGLLVRVDEPLDPHMVAIILTKVVERERPDLIIMGKQSPEDDSNQVGQLLAEHLGWPQATFLARLTLEEDLGGAVCDREVDGGIETIRVALPAVFTTDVRLNEPRYASLPRIMKARGKPVEEVGLEELGVAYAPVQHIHALEMPPGRTGGVFVESAQELVDKLRNEAKVL